MLNVHIWNVHTWALVATAAVANLLLLTYYAFHLLRKKMYATHPPMHKRTQRGGWSRLSSKSGNMEVAFRQESFRTFEVVLAPRRNRIATELKHYHIYMKTQSVHGAAETI